MKKKRIFISLALIASFSLASCDNDNTGSATIDRGTTDASPSTIVLPEEVVGTGSTNPSGIDPVEVEPIDTPTNSYESEIVGEYKLLQANSGIGYKFLGWYNGDKLISTNDSFKVLLSEADYITPKFELAPGFEYLEFTSTDTECVVTGLKEGCPIDFTLPEGITEIANGAFEYANICFLTLPKSLKKIGDFAFSNSGIVRVTFNSVPEIGENLFAKIMSIGSGGLLPIGYIGMISDPVDYSNVPSHQYQNDLDLEVFINVDTAEITENFANAMQNICTPIESLDESRYLLIDDYLFEIYEGEVRLDRYYGEDTNLVLPDGPDDLISYSINEYAIPMNAESVKFSKKVDWICDNAFYNCYALKTVELNEGLEGIGYDSFYYCTSLEEITIPSTVEEIDSSAFYNCSSLYTIYNYSNLEMYTYSAYGANPLEIITDNTSTSQVGLKNGFKYFIDTENNEVTLLEYVGSDKDIVIPTFDNYKIILTDGLFRYNKTIETVTLNEKVTSIGEYTFYGCSNLKSFDSMNLKSIGYSSFEDCTSLTFVNLPNVEYIDSRAFADCYNLSNISFPKVQTINSNSFSGCNSIRQLELPSTLTNIGYSAFSGCECLIEIINKSSLSLSKGSSNNGYVAYNAKNIITDGNDSKISEENGFVYYIDDYNKVLLDVKDKSTKKLVITSDVTSIALGAFKALELEDLKLHVMDNFIGYYFGARYYDDCSKYIPDSLTTIILGEEITSLPEYAFYKCTHLTNIDIPENVTYIGNYAFAYTGLEKIALKEGLDSVGYSVFENCKSLTSATLPSSLYAVGDSMFENCSSLQSVKISEGTTSIGSEAFMNCKSLYTVVIPSTISEIKYSAFENCITLESISLKNTTVTKLDAALFENCKNLVNIELPDTLTSINSSTFSGCDKLEGTVYKNGCYFGTSDNPFRWLVKARNKKIVECTVHPDCEKIYGSAFSNCEKLKKVVVPSTCTDFSYFLSGVTTLEYLELPYYDSSSKFSSLTGLYNDSLSNLQELVINGGTEIPKEAFKDYTNLKSITINEGVTYIDDSAFDGAGLTNITLPSTISTLGKYAFQNCKSLETADLSKINLTYINSYLFKNCSKLKNVILQDKAESIGSYAFQDCKSLESINLPNKCDEIGTYAFNNSGLKSIDLSYVWKIESYAFSGSNLETLKITNYNNSGSKVNLLNYAFANCKNLKTLTYDNTTSSTYNTYYRYLFSGCTSLSTVTLGSSTGTLGEYMFENCTSLKTIDISKVGTIKTAAFKGSGLETITIPSGITLNNNVFEKCRDLTTVTFKNGFDSMGTATFMDCSSLTTITMPTVNKWKAISTNTFKNCTSLSNFDFTDTTSIGESAFENTGFVELTLPSTVALDTNAFMGSEKLKTINVNCNLSTGCFNNCTALTDINLDSAITSIGSQAFKGCSSLTTFEIPSSITNIGTYAFSQSGLQEIIIPSTVTSVGSYAFHRCNDLVKVTVNGTCDGSDCFSRCYNLEEAYIGEGNTAITGCMFEFDNSLRKIALPSTLTVISYRAFNYCTSLTTITIPENVTEIASVISGSINYDDPTKNYNLAFLGCYNLVEVYNLSSLEIVVGDKFENGGIGWYLKTLHNSSSDASIVTIDEDGFVFVYADDKVSLIGYNGNEADLVLPDSVKIGDVTYTEYEIKDYAFTNYTGTVIDVKSKIKSIEIPASVKRIGEHAFYKCDNLKNVVLSEGLEEIGEYAFRSCTSLTNITIPSTVKSLASTAFYWCYKLIEAYNLSANVTYPVGTVNDNGYYIYSLHNSKEEKSIIEKDSNGYSLALLNNTLYIMDYNGNNEEIVLPSSFVYDGVTYSEYKLYQYAFAYTNIKSIEIPKNVLEIGDLAFYRAEIETVIIAPEINSESAISTSAFYGCLNVKCAYVPTFVIGQFGDGGNLTKVVLTAGKVVKEYSFNKHSKLTSVVLPNTITMIESYSFYKSEITQIFYHGTFEEFSKITVYVEGSDSPYLKAKKYYYLETKPTDNGSYWHYVDGEPTPW